MAQMREWLDRIPDEDLRCYAQQLYRSFPGKVCDVYDNSQSMDVFPEEIPGAILGAGARPRSESIAAMLLTHYTDVVRSRPA